MQWYLASLSMLFVLAGMGVLAGNLVLIWLPWRMRAGVRMFLSVPIGWSVLTLFITLPGWIGPGYARCHCALVTTAFLAVGAWTGRSFLRHEGWNYLRLGAFCAIASWPVLAPLLRFGTFNLYTDALTYASHAQWLQQHSFLETACSGGGHPAWETVVFMQHAHQRMGVAFLLGWTQALFGLKWSLDAYPALAALGLVCGALGVGATVLAVCPRRGPEAWLAALATAVTVNGFGFGATNGFLAQTWGLALFFAAFGLRSLEVSSSSRHHGGGTSGRTGVAMGICFAAAIHCYWDMLPLAGPALAASYLLPWPGWTARAWRRVWEQTRAPVLTCLLLVNLEWFRAFQGILVNMRLVVANPVAWPVWAFPAHALGLKSSIWEESQWIIHSASSAVLLAGCLAVVSWLVVIAAIRPILRWRLTLRLTSRFELWYGRPLIPALVWTTLSVLLFLYFRYSVASPWQGQSLGPFPDGMGQSWSQYKLTTWSTCALITLVTGLGIRLTIGATASLQRGVLVILLVAWCGTGLGWNFALAKLRCKLFLAHSGGGSDPLAGCRAMSERVETLPSNDWIYLDWPVNDGASYKYRDLMVYFLSDRSLNSDWKDSPLFAAAMSTERRHAAVDCAWVIHYQRPGSGYHGDAVAPGGMTLEKQVGH